jgi:hypothetical protein
MATCSYTVPDLTASGDTLYGPRSCYQPFVDWIWEAYDFDKEDWDDGFGWENACDTTMPLGRTFNGLWALEYSAPDPYNESYDMPIINWAGRFARENIDELDARCGDGSAWALTHRSPTDDWTQLYLGFFYTEQVPLRAGTIIHEARHASGRSHSDGGKDPDWAFNGAWTYDVSWLAYFENQCPNTTQAMKDLARQRANLIIDSYFMIHPGFHIQPGGFSG